MSVDYLGNIMTNQQSIRRPWCDIKKEIGHTLRKQYESIYRVV